MMTKVVAIRFLRGFVSSALAAMVLVAPKTVENWTDLQGWLLSLAFAGFVGGLSGGILAVDKVLRWKEDI